MVQTMYDKDYDFTLLPFQIHSNKTVFLKVYVTRFQKTNQIVTQDLFHFIDPANGYTCTLSVHSAITRFRPMRSCSPLSQLRQWDPRKA